MHYSHFISFFLFSFSFFFLNGYVCSVAEYITIIAFTYKDKQNKKKKTDDK